MMTDAEATAYLAELHRLETAGERTTLVIGPWTAFVMISALQLATRHPDLSPAMRADIGAFIDQARSWFTGTPGEELIRRGDDPRQDVPRETSR